MSDRYSRVTLLPENLYVEGAPVVIAAGALLKDNEEKKMLAQLKIRNIGANIIKAVKVQITSMDVLGNILGDEIEYQYLDLEIARDMDFGAKEPIVLSDATTRQFTVRVSEVIFDNGTNWLAGDAEWKPLDPPSLLESALGDFQLAKQYGIEYGRDSKYLYTKEKDLWWCPCGAINHQNEKLCHRCKKNADVLEKMDIEDLNAKRDERVAFEKEQEEQRRKEAAEQAKKIKKIAIIAVPIIVICMIFGVIISGNMKKRDDYNNAIALMEKGEDREATEIFTELGDYKDSSKHVKNIEDYREARNLMDSGEFEEAVEIFEGLGDFRASKEMVTKIEKVMPYIGEFVCTVDGEEKHLTSDFQINGGKFEFGVVYWKVEMPKNEIIGLYDAGSNMSHIFFAGSSLLENVGDIEDKMTASDEWRGSTLTAEFVNGEIVISGSGEGIVASDEFFNRRYVKVD